MKETFLRYAACPSCRGSLRLGGRRVDGVAGEIRSGSLECPGCRAVYPIREYIPRFVPSNNYAASFGLEWKRHARTQLDSVNGTSITQDRFQRATGWPADLTGEVVLEAGCGAGRFTEVALGRGCELISCDLSEAVEACLDNHGLRPTWHIFQGDLQQLPLRRALFDRVFCFGVLQHCPDPSRAFDALLPVLRPGGTIAIDVYERTAKLYVTPRFWLRFVMSRLPPSSMYAAVVRAVPRLVLLKHWLRRRVPGVGRYLAAMVPVISYEGVLPLPRKCLLEWAILDTFDALTPRYENRASASAVREWFRRAGLACASVEAVDELVMGRASKSAAPAPLNLEKNDAYERCVG